MSDIITYCEEQYKINFNHDSFWKIKATILMKKIYPVRDGCLNKGNIELYKYGVPYYEEQIRLGLQ
jgi:hypothetical protein